MNQTMRTTLSTCLLAALIAPISTAIAETPDEAALTATIAALDTKVFDAYNRCDLAMFGRYFSSSVEFYHDKGGATLDRDTVIANTKKYICGKVRRDLITNTFRAYAIKDLGAIEEGEHRFCELSSGNCDGIAKFVIVWQNTDGFWQITRVLSYGHRALAGTGKVAN